ncbi:MAG: HAD family hydrolase [Bdellovibrionales bacterium]
MTRRDFAAKCLKELSMTSLRDFQPELIEIIFTDIDGTLTLDGRLPESSYQALWRLHHAGKKVIPVTGRPAGWCDLIARFWPVHGVVGENGGLLYRYDGKKMRRHEFISTQERRGHRESLKKIAREVRNQVPKARIAADQFSRRFDLAIDFAEDVQPALTMHEIQLIKTIFEKHGAHAKISNIHVNGWFGDYDKLSACKWYCREWLNLDLGKNQSKVAYVGDSPNDEPMFAFFKNSFAVANVREFLPQMKYHPAYITKAKEGLGFVELIKQIV